jgi:hypothetical protein
MIKVSFVSTIERAFSTALSNAIVSCMAVLAFEEEKPDLQITKL